MSIVASDLLYSAVHQWALGRTPVCSGRTPVCSSRTPVCSGRTPVESQWQLLHSLPYVCLLHLRRVHDAQVWHYLELIQALLDHSGLLSVLMVGHRSLAWGGLDLAGISFLPS